MVGSLALSLLKDSFDVHPQTFAEADETNLHDITTSRQILKEVA